MELDVPAGRGAPQRFAGCSLQGWGPVLHNAFLPGKDPGKCMIKISTATAMLLFSHPAAFISGKRSCSTVGVGMECY